MTIWFTGCTHYGHANIIKLADRPFSSVEEMDEALIANHNAVVKPGDRVIHLGDFAWKKESLYLSRLNGQIMRMAGNHDNADFCQYGPYHEFHTGELDPLLQGEAILVLCHYPIEDWNWRYRGSIHLHCHTHAKNFDNSSIPANAKNYPPGRTANRFNVGVDATGFRPVSLDEILSASMNNHVVTDG